jgi:TonB family protein
MGFRAAIVIIVISSIGCRAADSTVHASRAVAPAYPPLALTAGAEGDVVVLATIDETGTVRGATVTQGAELLDGAALAAARRWSFNAGAASRQTHLTFAFRLNNNPATARESLTTFVPPLRVEVFGVLPPPTVNYDRHNSQ